MKVPTAKTPHNTALRLADSVEDKNMGIGIRIIIMSDEMLNTMLVIRWFVAALHWASRGQQGGGGKVVMMPSSTHCCPGGLPSID